MEVNRSSFRAPLIRSFPPVSSGQSARASRRRGKSFRSAQSLLQERPACAAPAVIVLADWKAASFMASPNLERSVTGGNTNTITAARPCSWGVASLSFIKCLRSASAWKPIRVAELLDELLHKPRISQAGLVVVGRTIKVQRRTCPVDRHLPVLPNRVDNLALAIRPQSVRLITSCSNSRSSVRSATVFFNRLFSSSSSRSRRISEGVSPAYFFFQLKLLA